MKDSVCYPAGLLRRMVEEGKLDQPGPHGHACGCRDCLSFLSATSRGNGGFPNGGLNIPESIQFFVGPPACGRHGDFNLLANGRSGRFYRIRLTEADLVNGVGPEKVERRICAFLDAMEERPKVVSLCITCVDALLHTNYARLGRRLEERYHIRFALVRMFPILEESAHTHAQMLLETQYSVLRPAQRPGRRRAVNLLGSISTCSHASELYRTLGAAGIAVQHILECRTLEEYDALGDACLNLVLVPNALPAARMLEQKWGIPYLSFFQTCDPDQIRNNYRALEEALGCALPVEQDWEAVWETARAVARRHAGKTIAVGAAFDYEPFKLAMDLSRMGLQVQKVFANSVGASDLPYLRWLEEHRPEMELYFGSEPESLGFAYCTEGVDLTIGLEASFFLRCPSTRRLATGEEPFEFLGLRTFLEQIGQALEQEPAAPAPAGEPDPYGRDWSIYRKELR